MPIWGREPGQEEGNGGAISHRQIRGTEVTLGLGSDENELIRVWGKSYYIYYNENANSANYGRNLKIKIEHFFRHETSAPIL